MKLILILLMVSFSSITYASPLNDFSIVADPYLQFNITGRIEKDSPDSFESNFTNGNEGHGGGYGARLGAEWKGIGVGIDYSQNTMTYNNKVYRSSTDFNVSYRILGIYGSYILMENIRLSATLFLHPTELYLDDDEIFKNGEGTKFTIGYQFENKLFVSLGYMGGIDFYKYDGPFIGKEELKIDKTVFVEMSLPFKLDFK